MFIHGADDSEQASNTPTPRPRTLFVTITVGWKRASKFVSSVLPHLGLRSLMCEAMRRNVLRLSACWANASLEPVSGHSKSVLVVRSGSRASLWGNVASATIPPSSCTAFARILTAASAPPRAAWGWRVFRKRTRCWFVGVTRWRHRPEDGYLPYSRCLHRDASISTCGVSMVGRVGADVVLTCQCYGGSHRGAFWGMQRKTMSFPPLRSHSG